VTDSRCDADAIGDLAAVQLQIKGTFNIKGKNVPFILTHKRAGKTPAKVSVLVELPIGKKATNKFAYNGQTNANPTLVAGPNTKTSVVNSWVGSSPYKGVCPVAKALISLPKI
jgi:hypothetical protein